MVVRIPIIGPQSTINVIIMPQITSHLCNILTTTREFHTKAIREQVTLVWRKAFLLDQKSQEVSSHGQREGPEGEKLPVVESKDVTNSFLVPV